MTKLRNRNPRKAPPCSLSRTFDVRGATSPRAEHWVEVRHAEKSVWIKFVDFADPASVKRRLAQKLILLGPGDWKALHAQVAELSDFPPMSIIEQPGWNGCYFALPSGEVFAPEDVETPHVLFEPDTRKCARSGSVGAWRRRVAAPLTDHPIPSFGLMLAFAAPLLALSDRIGNFGFELCGTGGCGKSTLQQLVSSALGGPTDGPNGHYWITMDSTRAGIALALQAHADLPMILDEAALHAPGSGQNSRGKAMMDLAFQLASGHEKLKHGQPSPQSYRSIFLISTNQSLRDLAKADHEATLDAAADRLISIPIADDRAGGIFERRPDGFSTVADFAQSLVRSAERNHGAPMRRFLRKLVEHRARDEEALRRRINEHLAHFRESVGVGDGGGSERRVVDAFGLIMAAGHLAKHYDVLPSNFRCEEAARYCYELQRHKGKKEASIVDKLVEISRNPGVRWVDTKKLPAMTNAQLDQTLAFLHRNRSRQVELLFWPAAFKKHFRQWARHLRDPALVGILNGDTDRPTVKRQIRAGRMDRVYSFILP